MKSHFMLCILALAWTCQPTEADSGVIGAVFKLIGSFLNMLRPLAGDSSPSSGRAGPSEPTCEKRYFKSCTYMDCCSSDKFGNRLYCGSYAGGCKCRFCDGQACNASSAACPRSMKAMT
ncbi:hypothetical protein HDE_01026 [Halotydeus destructor]|nr:hypothetical protein HDE_01026 [Halotydeus destructor]